MKFKRFVCLAGHEISVLHGRVAVQWHDVFFVLISDVRKGFWLRLHCLGWIRFGCRISLKQSFWSPAARTECLL